MTTETVASASIDPINQPPPKQLPTNRKEWLESAYISQHGVGVITVRQFTVTKAAAHPVDSYWEDSHIDWALEFLRRRHTDVEDVLIANTSTASQLYRIAMIPKYLDVSDTDTYRQSWAPLVNELKSHEIVVIPVNDGIKAANVTGASVTKDLAETGKTQKQNDDRPGVAQGNHWSIIVIDGRNQEQPTARYIDGMARARKGSRKWEVDGINTNAPIAGKILCGFGMLLGLDKDAFKTSTLKFTPHMADADAYRGRDHGRCGPYLYAFLDHLFETKLILSHPDVKANFNERLRSERSSEFGFDSNFTRSKLQYELHDERRRQERLQPLNARDNLTDKVLEAIRSILTVDQLISLAVESQDPSPPQKKKRNPRPYNSSRGNTYGNDDDDSDDWPDLYDECPRDLYKHHMSRDRHIPLTQRLNEAVNRVKTLQKSLEENFSRYGVLTKNPVYVYPEGFSKDKLPDFARLSNEDTVPWHVLYRDDIFKLGSKRNLGFPTIKAVLHRIFKGSFENESYTLLFNYINDQEAFDLDERSEGWTKPELVARLDEFYLELHVPLFATLSEDELDNWILNLHPNAKAVVQEANGNNLHNLARGMLYRFFVGALEDMSDEEVDEWRANDPAMPAGCKKDTDAARWWMDLYYHSDSPLPYLRQSPLHWPPRKHRLERGHKRKRDEDDNDDDDNNDADNRKKRPRSDEGSEGEDPKTIDWAIISAKKLDSYVTDEIRKDSRISGPSNSYTYRAIFFVKHGWHFKDEIDTRSDIWIRDINVFKHSNNPSASNVDVFVDVNGVPDVLIERQEIQRRMEARYETINTQPVESSVAPPKTNQEPPKSRKQPPKPRKQPRKARKASSQPTDSLPKPTQAPPKSSAALPQSTGRSAPTITSTGLDTTALAAEAVNFTRMTTEQIKEWVDLKPTGMPPTDSLDFWHQKTILQMLFGGFDAISDDDVTYWMTHDPLFKGGKRSSRNFVSTLKRRAGASPDFDHRGQLKFYPESYLNAFRAEGPMPVTALQESTEGSKPGPENSDRSRSEEEKSEGEGESNRKSQPQPQPQKGVLKLKLNPRYFPRSD
ncbi:Nn.00g022610.m01.CDS01 [Neocucurbitaria sp. VM-36]